jgi:hypothetical protein
MVYNLGRTDRAIRIIVGATMAAAGVVLRAHLVAAIVLLLAGLSLLVEATVGH